MTTDSNLRKILKYITFMKITEKISKLSYDTKHQVGSIIVKNDFSNISAIGYNGNFPDGENKRDSDVGGQSGFLHAEENVLIKSNIYDPEKHIIFITMTPCYMCAKRIATKGIKEVVALKFYPKAGDSEGVFKKSNIKFSYLNDKVKSLYKDTTLYMDFLLYLKDMGGDMENFNFLMSQFLAKQLTEFFDVNELDRNKIYSLDLNFDNLNQKQNVDEIVEIYLDKFYNILYELI